MYAIPFELYEKYGIRRYGFHGTSHRYVSARACEFLGIKAEGTKMVTCHVGNGGSIAAVKDGKCIDTSMGLTPLEGLVMGTRAGDIDGGAVTFIEKKLGLDADGMSNLLNKKSGVAGITGGSSDMRDVENAAKNGDERAKLAQDMYFYRIKKYIGAYAAAMGGLDVVVFTAGVGENQVSMRSEVCKDMEFLGIKFDESKNNVRGEEAVISADDSKVKVVVIPTDEEADDCHRYDELTEISSDMIKRKRDSCEPRFFFISLSQPVLRDISASHRSGYIHRHSPPRRCGVLPRRVCRSGWRHRNFL